MTTKKDGISDELAKKLEGMKRKLSDKELEELRCSFCGKGRDEVAHLIVGQRPDVAICDECTEWCWEIVSDHEVSPRLLPNRAT